MLNEFIANYKAWLTTCCILGLALSLLILADIVMASIIRTNCSKAWATFRKMKTFDKVFALVSVSIAIVYGGMKPVENAGADEGIALASVAVEYDKTNDVTAVEVRFTGNNVTTATPVSVRNDQTENWRELDKIGAIVTTDFATNTLAFAVAGNVTTNKFWWVGTETPAVIIETTGITITHFAASSSSVQIAWTCDEPNAYEYIIQRRRKGAKDWEWETVGVTTSLAFVYVGFTVGETWEWRVITPHWET